MELRGHTPAACGSGAHGGAVQFTVTDKVEHQADKEDALDHWYDGKAIKTFVENLEEEASGKKTGELAPEGSPARRSSRQHRDPETAP